MDVTGPAEVLDARGRPHPPWMQGRIPMGPSLAELLAARAAALPPLALKMCAGCTAQYAVEGDVGSEQGGTTWFGPCCPVPEKYAAVFIREAARG